MASVIKNYSKNIILISRQTEHWVRRDGVRRQRPWWRRHPRQIPNVVGRSQLSCGDKRKANPGKQLALPGHEFLGAVKFALARYPVLK